MQRFIRVIRGSDDRSFLPMVVFHRKGERFSTEGLESSRRLRGRRAIFKQNLASNRAQAARCEGIVDAVQESVAPDEGIASERLTPGGVWLEARSLCKVYRTGPSAITVLDGIDLSLRQGEMIAIVGPSGSGKSTLLHLLAALDTPTSGTVYFNAKALAARRSDSLAEFRNRRIGFVWQRHHLLSLIHI